MGGHAGTGLGRGSHPTPAAATDFTLLSTRLWSNGTPHALHGLASSLAGKARVLDSLGGNDFDSCCWGSPPSCLLDLSYKAVHRPPRTGTLPVCSRRVTSRGPNPCPDGFASLAVMREQAVPKLQTSRLTAGGARSTPTPNPSLPARELNHTQFFQRRSAGNAANPRILHQE